MRPSGCGYRVRDGYVELIGGLKLKIVGRDRRYDGYQNGEARLVYRDGKLYLMITKKVPKPPKYDPRGVLAVDINEKHVVVGNKMFEQRFETAVERLFTSRSSPNAVATFICLLCSSCVFFFV